jgi:thiamine biosynthesis lipoprotein
MKKTLWMTGLILGVIFFLSGCKQTANVPPLAQVTGKTMGTYYSVKWLISDNSPSPQAVKAAVDAKLKLVNAQMSTYIHDSELSLFNQHRSQSAFPVSQAMQMVVTEAQRIAQLTQGQYDVTVGPLVNLWSFGPNANVQKTPSDSALSEAKANIGYQNLAINSKGLIKANHDLYVDLSSIAKGYGVDVIARYLSDANVDNYLVDIGGELRLNGVNPQGKPWRIAIEKPMLDGSRAIQEVIEPGNMAMATSGDYRNFFEQNGVHYSHLINPKTGKPINNHVASVTVLAKDCMTADAWATAFSIMDQESSLALANKEKLPILLIVKTKNGFETRSSKAFAPYMNRLTGG